MAMQPARRVAHALLHGVAAALCLSAVVLGDATEAGKHITTKSGNTAEIGRVLRLNTKNFADHVAGEVSVFVKFYAPWCGHCKKVAPAWMELAMKVLDEPALKYRTVIAEVNADEETELAKEMGVQGYPTFIHFPPNNSSQLPQQYEGAHTVPEFLNFVKQRNMVQLSHKKSASKVFALDVLAWKFSQANSNQEVQDNMLSRMKDVLEKESTPDSMKASAEIYLKIMEKALKAESFETFFVDERSRLDRLLQSGQLSEDKLKDVTARRGIIEGFLKEPLLPGGVKLPGM
mmetsp:Transcript_38488/g.108780  ORF Transcript_38488/g.108780 Transcript_38488/m.108780 type:complete len:289 (-) Transcript_38488:220-1086(-)